MKKEQMLELKEKFPLILRDLGGDPSKTCMSWTHGGIAIGNGWSHIIVALMEMIQDYIDETNAKIEVAIPQFVLIQVKEKFGILRIYSKGGDGTTSAYVEMAEVLSRHTCEMCGKPGEIRSGAWTKVLCEECIDVK